MREGYAERGISTNAVLYSYPNEDTLSNQAPNASNNSVTNRLAPNSTADKYLSLTFMSDIGFSFVYLMAIVAGKLHQLVSG
jgi:hypothetical protein